MALRLQDLDTSKMKYNPSKSDFLTRMQGVYGFDKYTKKDKKQIFQYIALMYDINSPMHTEYGDYWERKNACAELCAFKKDSAGKYNKTHEKILLSQDDDINTMITVFVTSFGSADYNQLVFSWAMMHDILSQKPDRQNIDAMRKLKADINELTKSIFFTGNDDELTEVKKLLYKSAEGRRLELRPEDIAKALVNGDDFSDYCPYGEDYKVDKIKFLADNEVIAKKVLDGKKEKSK